MYNTEILQDIITDHKLCNTQAEELEKAIKILNHSDDIDEVFLKMCKKENKYQKINQECIDTVGVGIEMMPLKFKEFFDDFNEFDHYRELKEQGELIELPCKVGDFLEKELIKIKGISYIVAIPIEEFKTINELEIFVKKAKKEGIGVTMKYETSNFHCGVVAQIYDKKSCTVKECIND